MLAVRLEVASAHLVNFNSGVDVFDI